MKKWIMQFFVLFLTIGFAQNERPKLVVGVVVDQMRYDYLYRYYDDYSEDGFKKLLREGYNFQNTQFNYKPTYTAPGHSSVYTGAIPAVHGIVGNSWYHKSEKQTVYCTTDLSMTSVGTKADDEVGRMSPHRLKTTTITDQLKLATNHRSKVIGISLKDRGAILPAGHFADAAYWMDAHGKFVSSSFYFDKLPDWVNKYNDKKQVQKYINQGWDLLRPANTYTQSTADDTRYERVFKPKTKPTFPYNLKEISKHQGDLEIIKTTPYGNDLVAELSKEAIKHEKLGQGTETDFLAISFSSPDYIGHSFGIRSMEIQDTFLRLDYTIADLISYLNQHVGEGNYLMFLTADHAAAENPNYLSDHRYNVQNLNRKDLDKELKAFVDEKFGEGLYNNYSNQNVFLNEETILAQNKDYNKIVKEIQVFLEKKDFVTRAYTRDNILNGNASDYHLTLISNGFDPKQNGDLVVLLDPQYMEYFATGTTHGSTYMYDTHVPNLWYGWGIKHGKTPKKKLITQIAPTVSQLLNIAIPNGSEGDVLEELFD